MSKRIHIGMPAVQPVGPQQTPLRVLALFALGQMGWSLASFGAGNLLVYFYMPPEQGVSPFPSYIFQGPVFWILTLVGVVSALGRLLDGVTDPLIAWWSDRKKARLGKRRWFLLRGAIPLAFFGALIFFPANEAESATNFVWLAFCLFFFYLFFAFYVIPYNALMAELSHTREGRMRTSVVVSVAWALGFVLGNGVYVLKGYFEDTGMRAPEAFQQAIIYLHIAAAVLLLLPALFVNEQKYAKSEDNSQPFWPSLKAVAADQNFRWFLTSYFLYWLSLTFIQMGVSYYVTILLGLELEMAFMFSLASFAGSFILFFPVKWVAGRVGKKAMISVSFIIFSSIFLITSVSTMITFPKEWLLYGIAVLASIPLAVFGVLPNAIVGDEADYTSRTTGQSVTAMFYGVTAFTMKLGISVANLVFPSLLLFGRSTADPLGIQFTSLAAAAFCLAGWMTFRKYNLR